MVVDQGYDSETNIDQGVCLLLIFYCCGVMLDQVYS